MPRLGATASLILLCLPIPSKVYGEIGLRLHLGSGRGFKNVEMFKDTSGRSSTLSSGGGGSLGADLYLGGLELSYLRYGNLNVPQLLDAEATFRRQAVSLNLVAAPTVGQKGRWKIHFGVGGNYSIDPSQEYRVFPITTLTTPKFDIDIRYQPAFGGEALLRIERLARSKAWGLFLGARGYYIKYRFRDARLDLPQSGATVTFLTTGKTYTGPYKGPVTEQDLAAILIKDGSGIQGTFGFSFYFGGS